MSIQQVFGLILGLGVSAAATTALGEEWQRQLRIQVEWIELSHEDYTALMDEPDSAHPARTRSGNDGPIREKLAAMIKAEKARIIETAAVIARSGQRAKVESIYEYIYPAEYDAPLGARPTNDSPPQPPESALQPPNPAAFETRNVGTTVEVDPVIGADGMTIDLNLNPELVYLVDQAVWGKHKTKINKVAIKTPVFYTMRVTTSITTMAGEYSFIGVQSPPNTESGKPDTDRKVMVFVKADLLEVGLPVGEKEKKAKGGQ